MPKRIDTNYTAVSANASRLVSASKKKEDKAKQNPVKKFAQFLKDDVFAEQVSDSVKAGFEGLTDEEVLVRLQDKVHSKGDVLKKSVTLETIAEYKNAVKEFLDYAVENSFDFKKASQKRKSFREPKSSTIRVINEKLAQFTEELLTNQFSQLSLLARLEEIKGLLIDLLG